MSDKTLPHQPAELRKDLNEAMESRATLSQEIHLRFLRTGNRLDQLEGTDPTEEEKPSRKAPEKE